MRTQIDWKNKSRGYCLNLLCAYSTVHCQYHSSKFDRGFVLLDIMLTGFNRLSSDDKVKGIEYVWHVCVLFTMGSVWGQNNWLLGPLSWEGKAHHSMEWFFFSTHLIRRSSLAPSQRRLSLCLCGVLCVSGAPLIILPSTSTSRNPH